MNVQKCIKDGKPAFRLGPKGKVFTYTRGNSLSMKRAFGRALRNGMKKR